MKPAHPAPRDPLVWQPGGMAETEHNDDIHVVSINLDILMVYTYKHIYYKYVYIIRIIYIGELEEIIQCFAVLRSV